MSLIEEKAQEAARLMGTQGVISPVIIATLVAIITSLVQSWHVCHLSADGIVEKFAIRVYSGEFTWTTSYAAPFGGIVQATTSTTKSLRLCWRSARI